MKAYLDASAIVRVLSGGEGADDLVQRIEDHQGALITSPLARFEAVIALASNDTESRVSSSVIREAHEVVAIFLQEARVKEAVISPEMATEALEVAAMRKNNAPALSADECFAEAMAKIPRLRRITPASEDAAS